MSPLLVGRLKTILFYGPQWTLTTRRWNTTVANRITEDELTEWEQAKPFEQMPGNRSLPVIGTLWTLFPVVGQFFVYF